MTTARTVGRYFDAMCLTEYTDSSFKPYQGRYNKPCNEFKDVITAIMTINPMGCIGHEMKSFQR